MIKNASEEDEDMIDELDDLDMLDDTSDIAEIEEIEDIAEENQEVIQAFLETHPDFEQVALDHPCKDIVVNGCLAITPEQYLTDGFFIAQLRKKAQGYRGGNADASQKENYGNIIINGHWPKAVKQPRLC